MKKTALVPFYYFFDLFTWKFYFVTMVQSLRSIWEVLLAIKGILFELFFGLMVLKMVLIFSKTT